MNWLQKIAIPLPKHYFQFDDNRLEPLEQNLFEIYELEYAISELKRRMHHNQRLQYNHRANRWLEQMQEHVMNKVQKAGPEMLEHMDTWLARHSTTGFAEHMAYWIEQSPELLENNIGWGGGFEFDLKEPLIRTFIAKNEYFVDSWIQEEIDNLREEVTGGYAEEEQLVQLESMSAAERAEYVTEQIKEYGFDWEHLKGIIEEYENMYELLTQTIQQYIYPAWREYWGARIEEAEENVQQATDQLRQALGSNNLGQILVAINLALNAQHVHGSMYEHMDVSQSTLDNLSNLDTEQIDYFVDTITGENWKAASNWLKKKFRGNIKEKN